MESAPELGPALHSVAFIKSTQFSSSEAETINRINHLRIIRRYVNAFLADTSNKVDVSARPYFHDDKSCRLVKHL
eukprot:scaffold3100_cov248-Pinguiococcus_pyrenoidosus.AAC.2